MSCDARNCLRDPFWTLWQDLGRFGAKTFFIFFQAQNEMWCTKWLKRSVLNVLASFEPIWSEQNFFFQAQNEQWCTKWLKRAVLKILANFEPIRREKIIHFFSTSEWAVMHRNGLRDPFSTLWQVLGPFGAQTIFHFFSCSEWGLMHQMA